MEHDVEAPSGARYASAREREFDLIVIGGGIIGCSIAREAALRGLTVALFEKEDFGYGTSSRSTRLIHGGLRYLEMFDFGLVRQDLREREILLKTAPHRVQPLRFLIPLYRRSLFYRTKLRVGMLLYDLLSYDKSLPNHRFLRRAELLKEEPGLSPDGLQGAAVYYDAQVALPERLCLDNILDAVENGARIFNHSRVTGLLHSTAQTVNGIMVEDTLTGENAEVRAKVVIDVAGPWLDALTAKLNGSPQRPLLRLTKGIHFASPPATNNALVLFSEREGRLFFVIPWLGYAWVGTTDTDFQDDLDAVRAAGEDVEYLIQGVRKVLPHADWHTIYFTNAGVRALVRDERPDAPESAVSRKHRLRVHSQEGLRGLISVLGGKLTAARDIAQETVELAYRQMQNDRSRTDGAQEPIPLLPSPTQALPLPGGDFADRASLLSEARQRAASVGLDAEQADNLVCLYGTRYREIIAWIREDETLRARLADTYPDVRAQVVHAVEAEFARTASDFLLRRTRLCFTPDQGEAALLPIVREMARLLDWNEARQQSEITAYRAYCERTLAYRHERDPQHPVSGAA